MVKFMVTLLVTCGKVFYKSAEIPKAQIVNSK